MVTTRHKAAVESGEAPPPKKRYSEIEVSEHDETSPNKGKKGKKEGSTTAKGAAAKGAKKRGRPAKGKKAGSRALQREDESPHESDEEAKRAKSAEEAPPSPPQQQEEPEQREEDMFMLPEFANPEQFGEQLEPPQEQQQEPAQDPVAPEEPQMMFEPETQGMEEERGKQAFQEEEPTQAEEGGPPAITLAESQKEAPAADAGKAKPVEEQEEQKEQQEGEEQQQQPQQAEESPATATTTTTTEKIEGVVEQGRLLFFYRPKVEVTEASSLSEVQRFYMIFAPQEAHRKPRLAVIGKKRLPKVSSHERFFGFIEAVGDSVESLTTELGPKTYETKTRGTRHVAAARAVGEATYAIVNRGGSGAGAGRTHLVLKLIVPQHPGEVQEDFAIPQEGSYAFSIKNPKNEPRDTQQGGAGEGAGASAGGVIGLEEKADFPQEKKDEFGGYAWIGCTDPSLLEYERCEFLLVGATENVQGELGAAAEQLTGGGAECADSDEECLLEEMKKEITDGNEDVEVEMQPVETGEWK